MSEPLYSIYADDEDMAELVEMFVDEIPDRIQAIQSAHESGDSDQLRMLAHQLKGSAGSYGFQPITEAGAELENAVRNGEGADSVQASVDNIVGMLSRATASPEPNGQV